MSRTDDTTITSCPEPLGVSPLLFTKAQAAAMLSLAESSIDWMLRKGQLPHRKVAGKIRFTRSDLEALIEASAVTQCCATERKGA